MMISAELLNLIEEHGATFLVTAISAALGAYFGSYLKKKAENLATHEDIAKLVDQVSAVTVKAKSIEATISHDMWQRQTIRNEKKEAYSQILGTLGEMRFVIDSLRIASTLPMRQATSSKLDDLRKELYRIAPFAIMVLDVPASRALDAYKRSAELASHLDPMTPEWWEQEGQAVSDSITKLIASGRADLAL